MDKKLKELGDEEGRIKLTKKYYIAIDPRQYILQERAVTEAGREYYNNIGYFANLKHLSRGLLEHDIRTAKARDITGLSNHVDKLAKEIVDSLNELKGEK